jgi:hypothetical protein
MTRAVAERALLRLIDRSGLVQEGWYFRTYPDAARLGLSAADHYMRLGAAMGRNPSNNFDTRFYAQSVPGLAGSGMNPLAHYVLHGRAEGRVPHPRIALREVRRLESLAWGGIGAPAAAGLQALAEDAAAHPLLRAEAAIRLAPWLDFQGEAGRALKLLRGMEGWADPGGLADRRRLIPLAFLQMAAGRRATAAATLAALPEDDADAVLARANAAADDAARLATINRLYAAAGLAPLVPADPAAPLGLYNIAGAPVAPGLPDVGKVSVIIPAYKAEGFIAHAIRGLQQQTYRNLEILVVDDCSPDGTLDVVRRLAQEDARIIPLQAPKNGGAYPARNIGLQHATGDFLTTHDADDWSHPQKIEQQLAPLAADPARMASAVHWVRCRPDLRVTTNWRLSADVLHWSYSSFLFRRAVLDRLGPWDAVRAGADTEYVWRFESVFGQDAFVRVHRDVPLAWALDDDSSLTRSKTTHISTNYHGLRHIYREVCHWWLGKPAALLADGGAAKRRMIPREMTEGPQPPRALDLHILGDLTLPAVAAAVAAALAARPGLRAGLTHRPDPAAAPGHFGPEIMALAETGALELLVPGVAVEAAETLDIGPEGTS